jgi:hypothetical protein
MPTWVSRLFSQPCSVKIENHTIPAASSLIPSGKAKMYSHRSVPFRRALTTSAMPIATTNWIGTIMTTSSRVVVRAFAKRSSPSMRRMGSKL